MRGSDSSACLLVFLVVTIGTSECCFRRRGGAEEELTDEDLGLNPNSSPWESHPSQSQGVLYGMQGPVYVVAGPPPQGQGHYQPAYPGQSSQGYPPPQQHPPLQSYQPQQQHTSQSSYHPQQYQQAQPQQPYRLQVPSSGLYPLAAGPNGDYFASYPFYSYGYAQQSYDNDGKVEEQPYDSQKPSYSQPDRPSAYSSQSAADDEEPYHNDLQNHPNHNHHDNKASAAGGSKGSSRPHDHIRTPWVGGDRPH